MTVNTLDIISGPYIGNNVTTQFSYDFRVEDKTQLTVFETDNSVDPAVITTLTVDTDYTVNNIGTDGGGTIDRVAGALPTGDEWYIRSDYIATQLTDLESQGGFFPDVHEAVMDKTTFLIQQHNDLIRRSVRFSDSYSGNADTSLPAPDAGKTLAWSESADSIVNGPSSNDITTAVVDAQTAQAAAETAQSTAETNATLSQLAAWDAEAEVLTANSYALQPEDVFVNIYTSDDDGTFTVTATTEYSSLHWAAKADASASTTTSTHLSVAAMVADTALGIGQKVRTLGYYSAGDGGGNDYEIVAAASGTADGGSYIDLSTHQAKGLFNDSVINIKKFGAVADGADSLEDGDTVKGDWVTATSYVVGDLIWESSSGSRLGYICAIAHTSGTFATDLTAVKWVVGSFSGTDNTSFLANAVAYHELTGRPLYVPSGDYKCINPSTTSDSAYITLAGDSFEMDGSGRFFLDEDLSTPKNYNFFKTTLAASNTDRALLKTFKISGVSFKGRWSHAPGGNVTSGSRTHVFYLSGYDDLDISKCNFSDIAGSVSRINTCNGVLCDGNTFYQIGKGSARFLNCNSIRVVNNKISNTDDDSIDCHANANGLRTNIVISNNQLFNAEGIIALGARSLTCSSNTLQLCHGTIIYLGGRVSDEGDNASYSISCIGNTVVDSLSRSNDGSTLAVSSATSGALTVSGVPSSWQAGSYTGTVVRDPLTTADIIYDNIDLDTTNVTHSGNIVVSSNPIKRTLPVATNYSDWGYGLYFHDSGWIDPAVIVTNFKTNAIVLNGDMENFVVNPIVSGFRSGAGVYLNFTQTTDTARVFSFRNGYIGSGVIRDCLNGVQHSRQFSAAPAPLINMDVTVDSLVIDLDPYHISVARTSASAGTWNTGASVADRNMAIGVRNTQGIRASNNTIKNCFDPFYGEDTGFTLGFYSNNNLHCEPVSHLLNAGNIGIARPLPAGPEVAHTIVKGAPSGGSFDQINNACLRSGTAVPTSGIYVIGHEFSVNMTSGVTVDRYRRATTGNAHVVGTDWKAF